MQKRDELMQIAINLKNWAKKYNKDYVNVFVINNNVHASVDTADKDYKNLDINIYEEEL